MERGRRAAVNVLIAAAVTNTLPGLLNTRRVFTASAEMVGSGEPAPKFQRLQRLQFIAALGDPGASSGTGADTWGLWREDPGPQGVRLGREYQAKLEATGGKAPAGWQFDPKAWWLEEHGLIMEQPDPLPAGKYVVTGAREVTTVLDVKKDGGWTLRDGSLYDVTHLPCRSARYTPPPGGACSPASAAPKDFPVTPGAAMPGVTGCAKQDYAVLFIVGVEDKAATAAATAAASL